MATIGLTLFAPLLAKAAIHFGPADYFALYVMAFTTIGGITGTDPRKTLLAAMLGLFTRVFGLPAWGLMPLVVAISYLGVYAIAHAAFGFLFLSLWLSKRSGPI
ncbi:tripartite tricarboxylate transporter permease [Paracoccus methylarcula]|uniref:tripartite tricarboxylate transporter permease n=1 Tax=Paracoccus methylarcula TaxID=72022 RepID=UPI001FEAC5E0|nr:tripartite tricarboxylate transporter permease [Paracoccus methylarcula]